MLARHLLRDAIFKTQLKNIRNSATVKMRGLPAQQLFNLHNGTITGSFASVLEIFRQVRVNVRE